MTSLKLTKPLVIYHAACRDGWCAAWVARRKYPDAELFEGFHGAASPNVTGRDVLMADFSYPRAVLEAMARESKSLTIFDHHKTAREALTNLPGGPNSKRPPLVVFDLERSGAGITWDVLFPAQPRSWLVDYIEDRDLWRHALPDSETVNAYISTLKFDEETWNDADAVGCLDAAEQGRAVLAKTNQYVREVCKNAMRVHFEGHNVPIVNAPQVDISELLHALCDGEMFAMGWWQRKDGMFSYGLRSRGDFDVSELAKKYGGGGHKNAAGFQSSKLLTLT